MILYHGTNVDFNKIDIKTLDVASILLIFRSRLSKWPDASSMLLEVVW